VLVLVPRAIYMKPTQGSSPSFSVIFSSLLNWISAGNSSKVGMRALAADRFPLTASRDRPFPATAGRLRKAG